MLYVRVPRELHDAITELAAERSQSITVVTRELLAAAMRELTPPLNGNGRDPWVDRARLAEAMRALLIAAPSGYDRIPRIINGALERAGDP